jgi:hypothetical protein
MATRFLDFWSFPFQGESSVYASIFMLSIFFVSQMILTGHVVNLILLGVQWYVLMKYDIQKLRATLQKHCTSQGFVGVDVLIHSKELCIKVVVIVIWLLMTFSFLRKVHYFMSHFLCWARILYKEVSVSCYIHFAPISSFTCRLDH